MHKALKGVIAASSGAILLIGGAGTLAFWSSNSVVGGGAINGGTLSIGVDATNTGCGAWVLDTAESAPSTYTVGDPLVPGDVLTRVCRYTIHATGNHLRATVGVSNPTFSGAGGNFGGKLTAAVSALDVNGQTATDFTEANDGERLTARVSVTWNGADISHQAATTVLDDLTLTAQQVHS